MNTLEKLNQFQVDRMLARSHALDMSREAQKQISEHLNKYYLDENFAEPLKHIAAAILLLKNIGESWEKK